MADQKVHELEVPMELYRQVNETGDLASFHRSLRKYVRSDEREPPESQT
jgi:hypothetical protein